MLKKIKTEKQIQYEKKRNQLIVGVVLSLLMVLSSVGYAVMSNDSGDSSTLTKKYGNLVFTQTNGFWATQVSGKTLFFNSLPEEVSNVSVNGTISINDYYEKSVYFVNSNGAVNGVANALTNVAFKMQEACLEGQDCTNKDLPVKNCNDTLIIFDPLVQPSSIQKIGNCIYLYGDSFKSADKFIYRLFNIA